jgi:hypothetical protein
MDGGSGVMMYIPSLMKIDSGVQNLKGRGSHRQADRMVIS